MILEKLNKTRSVLEAKFGSLPRIALVLGSGLSALADEMDEMRELSFGEIPHFRSSTVSGHQSRLLCGHLYGVPALILQGRLHLYEGYSLDEVVFPVRALAWSGVETVVLTNAAGGLDKSLQPADLLLLRDHINLMGTNPLIGPNEPELGPRFPDLTDLYEPHLREVFLGAAREASLKLREGVYVAIHGPSYETPSEVKMYRAMGGDAVGMSTVPEAIALRHMGKRVVGLSCITNLAAGVGDQPLSHEDVLETGRRAYGHFVQLLREHFQRLEAFMFEALSLENRDSVWRELVVKAKDVQARAYAPYSHHLVGSVIRAQSGQTFSGCNVENASYPATTCAERTALVKMVSEGFRTFDRLVVVSSLPIPCFPCGICLQVLAEFGLSSEVLALNADLSQSMLAPFNRLYPSAFSKSQMDLR